MLSHCFVQPSLDRYRLTNLVGLSVRKDAMVDE